MANASVDRFYTDVPAFADARDVCNLAHYHEVPDGWTVIVTDVEGSTKAIEAGRYRDVNLIGAATITAARNAVPTIEIAYVFGGDGATLLVPDSAVATVRAALLGLRAIGIERFGLKLRVGGVTIAELRQRGAHVLVAKLEISRGLCLAMFAGGGLAEADHLVKKSPEHLWSADQAPPPDLKGLECRWRPIASEHGEILSVLIRATAGGGAGPEAATTYNEIIGEMSALVGDHEDLNPARSRSLKVARSPLAFRRERKMRQPPGYRFISYVWDVLITWVITLVGIVYMERRTVTDVTDWGHYRDTVVKHSDYWKYDDTLRFVIDVTPEQKRKLIDLFERYERSGQIVFGVHAAAEAVMTCVVFDHDLDHVHFIDGGDGGYARAAKVLKQKLK